jgi:hypothetical protein
VEKVKDALILCALATFCTLAHFFFIYWFVHLLGHGYKWITVLVGACWVSVFLLLVANLRLTRRRSDERPKPLSPSN